MQQLDSSTSSNSAVLIQNLELESIQQLPHPESGAIYGGIVTTKPVTEKIGRSSPVPERLAMAQTASWSPTLQTLLDQPPSSFPRHLLLGGLLFGTVLIAWAWLGKVQEISHAQGRLMPQGELYKVQPVTQGEIAKLLVTEGQSVKAGQVIAELDNRLAASEIDRLKQVLAASELRLFQTQELIDRTQLEAQTRRAIAAAGLQAQTASIQQVQAQARSIQTLLPQLQAEKAAYESRLGRLQPLAQEGAIAQDRLFEIE